MPSFEDIGKEIIPKFIASWDLQGIEDFIKKYVPKDDFRELLDDLARNPAVLMITKYNLMPNIFYAAGFVQEDGIYHTRQDALQQYGGYNDLYDFIFKYASDMDRSKLTFTHQGKEYVLWGWKGDYLNLGAGGELGIYEQVGNSEHYAADPSLALPMTLKVKYKNKQIFTYNPQEKQWWITGFDPSTQRVKAKDLVLEATIDFSGNKEMYNSIKKTGKYNQKNWKLNDVDYTIQLKF